MGKGRMRGVCTGAEREGGVEGERRLATRLYSEGKRELYGVKGGYLAGTKTGHYKACSVSSVMDIGGSPWKWEEQLGGHGSNSDGDAAALN